MERLERHLRRLSHQVCSFNQEIYTQLRFVLTDECCKSSIEHPEYQGICWLIEQEYLSVEVDSGNGERSDGIISFDSSRNL